MVNTLLERLTDKVKIIDEGCWVFTGYISKEGYGRLQRGSRGEGVVYAHRAMWELNFGEIPKDMTVDHICLNRACINIKHLQLLDRSANGKRAWETSNPADREYKKADDTKPCKRGHLAWYRNKAGHRRCAACRRMESDLYG